MKLRKFREKANVFVVKHPARAILIAILIFNIVLIFLSAFVISKLTPSSVDGSGFWASVFYTISMILDAGCVQYVVEDIGQAGVGIVIVCMLTVLIGMITFTGAVIGYITNTISNFIENSNSGRRPLSISGHTVILNWNSRASEIINDLLYTGQKETIIVLVNGSPENVMSEINDRISTTLKEERQSLLEQCENKSRAERRRIYQKLNVKNRLTVIVRQGDTYSSKALNDVSVQYAKTVILLSADDESGICKYDVEQRGKQMEKGDANVIKSLVQVAEMTSSASSADDQIIIVEVEDRWTLTLVNRVISHKEKIGKCNIIAVPVNKVLGQILSQFSIMPELNTVYSNLFSNKGAEFFCQEIKEMPNLSYEAMDAEFLDNHTHALPLTLMETKTGTYAFYVADDESDVNAVGRPITSGVEVEVNPNYQIRKKTIVIIGHNSKCADIMDGFEAFRAEWNQSSSEVLNIIVIDDKKGLERRNYYRQYPYVTKVVEADVYDSDLIYDTINEVIDRNSDDISVLILSDDAALPEDIDANALTYLVYVQDIIFRRISENSEFDRGKVDVIVEILNPKHYDVVHNYSVNNVVISNRYISKMVTQISRKDALYEFYRDILTYDEAGSDNYESKELYIKPVSDFLADVPAACSAAELIRAVYTASPDGNKSIVIGYVAAKGDTHIFSGDQNEIPVELSAKDKLIIFSNH